MTGLADDELKALLQKLSEQAAHEVPAVLSASEVETVRRMIKVFLTAEAMGTAFGFLKKVAIWVAAIGTGYVAFRAGVLEWLGIDK